jgi:hypothetical protein
MATILLLSAVLLVAHQLACAAASQQASDGEGDSGTSHRLHSKHALVDSSGLAEATGRRPVGLHGFEPIMIECPTRRTDLGVLVVTVAA